MQLQLMQEWRFYTPLHIYKLKIEPQMALKGEHNENIYFRIISNRGSVNLIRDYCRWI